MGTGYSGLFNGTQGSKNSRYHSSAKIMHERVKTWAENEIETLETKSKRQREKFNTASIVYDKETGKYYYGKNKGALAPGVQKNEQLFGEKGVLPKKSFNAFEIGNCAEVDAINQALNNGAKLENLYMYTIHTTKTNFGMGKKACENCTFAFKGRIKENHSGWEEL